MKSSSPTMRLLSFVAMLSFLVGQWLVVTPPVRAANSVLTNAALATVTIFAVDRHNEVNSRGSGVLLTEGGLVLTNYHVIEENQRPDGRVAIWAPNSPRASRTRDFTPYWGTVLDDASDPDADLALVQIDLTFDEEPLPAGVTFPTVSIGDPAAVNIDDEIHILGYPGIGNGSLVTVAGRIIGVNEDDGLPWLLTDATIAGGSSGGAVINQTGELIAIPTVTVTDEHSGNTFGYLRPIDLALPLIEQAGKEDDATDVDLLCMDGFSSNGKRWPLGFDDGILRISETVIAGGTYQESAFFKQAAYTWNNAPDCEATDFLLQVDVMVLDASHTDAGIVLLLRDAERNGAYDHYRVIYYPDNSYEIDLYRGDEQRTLQERTPTRHLTFDTGEMQRLAVLLVGDRLTVYANDQELTTVQDDTLTAAGKIGLGVAGDAGQQIHVAFDNFMVAGYKAPAAIFADTFDNNQNDWDLSRFTSADLDCKDQIVDGRLQHRVSIKTEANVCYSTAPTLAAQDFWLQVDAIWLQHHVEGSWAEVAFRYDKQTDHQYNLRLTQDGYYLLEQYYEEGWHTLQDWTQSSAINGDRGETNTIQLWVRGPYITLVINSRELVTIEDDRWLTEGAIMLGLGGDPGVRAFIAFDNLLVHATPPTTD